MYIRRMLTSIVKYLIAAAGAARFYGSVRDCGADKSLFLVNSVSLDPAAPIPGDKVALTLDYTVPPGVYIGAGQVEYDVKYNYMPLAPTFENLCENVPCPLGPGTYLNTTTTEWPSGISGRLVTKMKWLDSTNALLLCIEISDQAETPSSLALTHYVPRRA